MADEPLPGPDLREPDEIGLLPFDEDAENEDASRRVDPVAPDKFLYIGEGKNAEGFVAVSTRPTRCVPTGSHARAATLQASAWRRKAVFPSRAGKLPCRRTSASSSLLRSGTRRLTTRSAR